MTRVAPSSAFADIPVIDLGQGDRINLGVASLVSRLPKVAEALGALTAALKSGTLPPRLLELVRLRIAFHNQCRSCMSVRYQSAVDDGLTEDAVCSLERPADAPDLSDAERAALKFADLFATNHLAIDESIYDELRRYLTEDAVCSLERPADAPDLSDAERAALKFADLFATNHLAIDESVYDELRRYLTEDELVELGMHCAVSLGVGRLTATWDVTDDVPEAFRSGDDRVTPWASTGVIASG
jgi:AhpD family alkylhydroperoxidase